MEPEWIIRQKKNELLNLDLEIRKTWDFGASRSLNSEIQCTVILVSDIEVCSADFVS